MGRHGAQLSYQSDGVSRLGYLQLRDRKRPVAAGWGFHETTIQIAAPLRLQPFPMSVDRSEAISQFHS